MMLKYGLIVSLVFMNLTKAVWYNDVISPEGWHFGEGMVFHIKDTKSTNSSFFDRLSLRLNFGDVEISATQKPEKDAVQLDFFVNQNGEGRAKKSSMGNMLIPFFLGAAKGGAVALMLSTLKMFALKSLLLAKMALFISIIVIASKYMKKSEPEYVEYEPYAASDQIPAYEYLVDAPTINQEQAVELSPYHAYAPSEMADGTSNYATVVAATANNGTVASKRYYLEPTTKRQDQGKRKILPSVLTIRHYS